MRRRAVAIIAVTWMLAACGDPGFVERIILQNPSEYNMVVEVSDDGRGWLNLGGLERESEQTVREVIDFGERWIFRFHYPHDAGIEPAQVVLTRQQLASADWRVKVPDSLIDQLRARREPPSFKG